MSQSSFWRSLPPGFLALAPMEDVTDTVFRQIVIRCARPNVCFSEFTNTDGIVHNQREAVNDRLKFDPREQPIVAQLWGTDPDHFYQSARLVERLGFAGIDINLGCPEKKVVKRGACSAMIGNRIQVAAIVDAIRHGAPSLPVSIKTRLGYREIETPSWFEFLLTLPLSALTIHGRTALAQSAPPANWDEIARIVRIRDSIRSPTLVIGNGDILSLSEAKAKIDSTKVDGVMIGRGVLHNPWIFSSLPPPDPTQRLKTFANHIELFEKTWGNRKSVFLLRKFAKAYITGFPNAARLRLPLMTQTSLASLKAVCHELAEKL